MLAMLKNQKAWVTMHFDDNSVKCIQTTLNKDILASFGVTPKAGYFYDLVRGEYVAFREDAIKVDVTTEKPIFEDEVINFANRFI